LGPVPTAGYRYHTPAVGAVTAVSRAVTDGKKTLVDGASMQLHQAKTGCLPRQTRCRHAAAATVREEPRTAPPRDTTTSSSRRCHPRTLGRDGSLEHRRAVSPLPCMMLSGRTTTTSLPTPYQPATATTSPCFTFCPPMNP
jgi:hypothetical protein